MIFRLFHFVLRVRKTQREQFRWDKPMSLPPLAHANSDPLPLRYDFLESGSKHAKRDAGLVLRQSHAHLCRQHEHGFLYRLPPLATGARGCELMPMAIFSVEEGMT